MKKKFQIVVDSSSDMELNHFEDKDILFSVAPLTIHVDGKEFIDNADLDVTNMLKEMHDFDGKSTSSCPAPGVFAELFEQAEYTVCITMTGALSGTYNSACQGASIANENGCNVKVVDSKLTAGALLLIAEECYKLMKQNLSFDEIVSKTTEFAERTQFLFVLDKFDNLIKNGRMSKVSGLIAGLLKIKPIASAIEGEIKVLEKKRTSTMAFKRLVEIIGEKVSDFNARELIISHCFDSEMASILKEMILEKYNFISIRIRQMKGLCSFYSLEKGIIVSF